MPNNTVVFDIVIEMIFESIFCLKIHQDNIFYFLKNYFYIIMNQNNSKIKKKIKEKNIQKIKKCNWAI
jgi:hypothetical protein